MRARQMRTGRTTAHPTVHTSAEARSELVVLARSRSLCSHLRRVFGERLLITRSWPGLGSLAAEVLLIDLAMLSGATWSDLVRFSRQQDRPALLLIDHLGVDRRMLARVAADELLAAKADVALITHAIQEHLREGVFHVAANAVSSLDEVPYPLGRFLSAAFTDSCSRVGRLATAYGFKQSTLRNQWRRVRADPTLRLEDVLGCVAVVKAQSRTMSNEELRTAVNQLIRRMFGRSIQEPTG